MFLEVENIFDLGYSNKIILIILIKACKKLPTDVDENIIYTFLSLAILILFS